LERSGVFQQGNVRPKLVISPREIGKIGEFTHKMRNSCENIRAPEKRIRISRTAVRVQIFASGY
jgi:hypothetical protein